MSQLLFKLLRRAGGIAPAPSFVYGAVADAGEVNTADVITGTRYYFDATTGSDANAGTSEALPAQSMAKLFDYTTTTGGLRAPRDSALMLSRGDTWYGLMHAAQFDSSNYGNYIFGAFGTGARPKVRYSNSPALNKMNSTFVDAQAGGGSKWRNLSLDAQYTIQATASAVVGTFVAGDVVTGGTSGATGLFDDSTSGRTSIICTSLPTIFTSGETITAPGGKSCVIASLSYPTGIYMRGPNEEVSNCEIFNVLGDGLLLETSLANNTLINNSTIYNCCYGQSNGAGIAGGGVSNLTITNNTVYDCGGISSSTSHNIYVGDVTTALISGNHSYMTTNRGNSALVMHGVCSGVTIEGNLFEKCGNGIAINDGHGTAEYYDSFTIRRNINRLHGTLSGQTQGLAMELACLTNSAIYNNLNYSTDLGYTLVPKRTSGGADTPSHDVTISHETLYNVTNGMTVTGTGMTNIIVQNCIFMSTAASGLLFTVDALALSSLTFRNCLFYMPNNAGNAISWNGTSYTIAAFLAGPGAGMGHVTGDPLFINAATGDFRVSSGSPAKAAGYAAGITTDFYSLARNMTTPTIGAIE